MLVASVRAFWSSLSALGLLLGSLFFAASLTPSLVPRDFLLQGGLGGFCFSIGYGLGVLTGFLWNYLGLPSLGAKARGLAILTCASLGAAVVVSFLMQAAAWQNSIRQRMEMEPVHSAHPFEVAGIAVAVLLATILLARVIAWIARLVFRLLDFVLPRRLAGLAAVSLVTALVVLLADGLLFRGFLRAADYSLQTLDRLIEPDLERPSDPMRTGSSASLIDWKELGRMGRNFVATGPSVEDLTAFGESARLPLRVYAGLNSAPDPEARAGLALEELIRVGGFDRSILIVATPTGTGWMDQQAMDTLEYLHRGDTAIVGMQYSYLWSWMSLLVEPGYGVAASRALFRKVYRHWASLPPDSRPRLYLFGLSLGALSSEQSVGLHEVLADPFQGAVWSGPPFASPGWRSLTQDRNPGTPAWLPVYGDESVFRFMNQRNAPDIAGAAWGPLRVIYLQYASDPITFFSSDLWWRKPDWMEPPLGFDVSPELRWYPVVTFLQLALDTMFALNVPHGFGHLFAPQHYIDAWIAVTEPQGWSAAEIARLKARFKR